MGQWGARCLENDNGYDYDMILRFYYGADIEIPQAPGPCVLPMGAGGSGGAGGADVSGGGGDGGGGAGLGGAPGEGGGTGGSDIGDEGDDGCSCASASREPHGAVSLLWLTVLLAARAKNRRKRMS